MRRFRVVIIILVLAYRGRLLLSAMLGAHRSCLLAALVVFDNNRATSIKTLWADVDFVWMTLAVFRRAILTLWSSLSREWIPNLITVSRYDCPLKFVFIFATMLLFNDLTQWKLKQARKDTRLETLYQWSEWFWDLWQFTTMTRLSCCWMPTLCLRAWSWITLTVFLIVWSMDNSSTL